MSTAIHAQVWLWNIFRLSDQLRDFRLLLRYLWNGVVAPLPFHWESCYQLDFLSGHNMLSWVKKETCFSYCFYAIMLFFFFFDMAGPQPGKTRGYACPVVSPLTLPSPPCSTSMILLVPCAMQPALQVSSFQQGNASAADCLEFELPAVEACSNCPRMLTAKIWTQERRYESTIWGYVYRIMEVLTTVCCSAHLYLLDIKFTVGCGVNL